jgi:hypothetical protein
MPAATRGHVPPPKKVGTSIGSTAGAHHPVETLFWLTADLRLTVIVAHAHRYEITPRRTA